MDERGHCDMHRLARGPDGMCVLCRRSLASDPLAEVSASPTASTRVGLIVTLGSLGLMAAIAASMWFVPTADKPRTSPVTTIPVAAPAAQLAVAATTADTARRQELARLAKSDIWQRSPDPIAPEHGNSNANEPARLEVVPVAAAPSATHSPAALAAQQQRQVEEAQRDQVRHAAVAAQIEQRARDHAISLQTAALAEARGKVRIDVYTAAWCGNCRRAIAYLRQQTGLRYALHDIDVEPRARERMHKLNPRHSIPTFEVDNTVVVGFSERSFEQALDSAARARAGLRPE